MNFKEYRQKSGYSEKSIRVQDSHVNSFKSWCIRENVNFSDITYNQALKFIDSERDRGISRQSIIREINSIRIYFDYLLESGTIKQNVIKRIRIRQSGKKVLPEILSPAQLEKIYHDFLNLPAWNHGTAAAKLLHQRNIVILGLMIYQGLDSGEIARLETGHITLSESKIYIPSGRKSNSRSLRLQAMQILSLKTYLEETRRELLEKRNLQSPYLFPAKKSSDMVCKIVEAVKKIHPELKDSRQMRSSVLMNWLKTNNIRQVQYMAGHKSIRSTEAYRREDLTDLTKQLELFHPLR
ncbi:MAG TPA: tyrosine-type recombinase/integrase [Candidatus Cloacimonadota bacterium]|jgi:integrase/recombinase XerD|nr:tyrosine-type recombinase/integrase [Candidatus Cloacimonadota bacterium]